MDDMPYLSIHNLLKDCAELLREISAVEKDASQKTDSFQDLKDEAKEVLAKAILIAEENSVIKKYTDTENNQVEVTDEIINPVLHSLLEDLILLNQHVISSENYVDTLVSDKKQISDEFIGKVESLVSDKYQQGLNRDLDLQNHLEETAPF